MVRDVIFATAINHMKRNMSDRPIILVGGGTGGHIFPLIAIGEELQAQGKPFIFVGGKHGNEQKIVEKLGWQFVGIEAGKWRRYFSLSSALQNIGDGVRVIIGFFQAISLLRKTGASLVFSKGGYVALPFIYATKVLGRKLIVHESDAIMGLTNRLGANFASRVLTAFSTSIYPQADGRYLQVGIPIRRALRQATKLKSPTKDRQLILIIGGSQGSLAMNNLFKPLLAALVKQYDVVHSTGEADFEAYDRLRKALPKTDQPHYKPYAFIDRELPYYYQAADLIVARSSATTLAEAATFSKALYLIPLPSSASNHQLANARKLEAASAAIVREQYQLNSERLRTDLAEILNNRDQLKTMGDQLRQYFNQEESLPKIMNEITNG